MKEDLEIIMQEFQEESDEEFGKEESEEDSEANKKEKTASGCLLTLAIVHALCNFERKIPCQPNTGNIGTN